MEREQGIEGTKRVYIRLCDWTFGFDGKVKKKNMPRKPAKKTPIKRKNTVPETRERVKRPSTGRDVSNVDFAKLGKEHGLTEMQTKFCYYYVFVCNLNGRDAVECAGYSSGKYDEKDYDERTKKYYEDLVYRNIAKNMLDNPKVLELITRLRDELNNQLIVDKLYVLQNLKRLAETATESIQLRALEKLGETMELFGQKTIIEEREDPSRNAREAFQRRKEAERSNVVEFSKEVENG